MTSQHNHFHIKYGPLYLKDWEMMTQCNSYLTGKEFEKLGGEATWSQ